MRFTGIAVEGVGKFGRSARLEGLSPGVNVLMAPNEAGKSTLFRALRAGLFERHKARTEPLRSLASDGLSLPVTVTLEFEHEGASYRLCKSFLKSPAASLQRDGTEIARGDRADELVWELLGVSRTGSRTIDDAAFGLLWVGQGQSFRLPELSNAATSALNAAIQAEIGDLVGGERARNVLNTLHDEIRRFVTETGRPKAGGPLMNAEERLKQVTDDLAEVEQRLAVLDEQLVQLTAKQAERARWADPAEVARQTAELDEARKHHKAAESVATLLAQYEGDERQARTICETARQRLDALMDCARRIDQARERLARFDAALIPLDEREKEARRAIAQAREGLNALNEEMKGLEAETHALGQIKAIGERAVSRDRLKQRRRLLASLAERQARNVAALAANAATAAVIASLDRIERERDMVIARLEAAAPRVSITLGEQGAGRVQLNGELVANGLDAAALDPMIIKVGDQAIGDVTTVSITPAAASLEADRETLRKLEAGLAVLLAKCGQPDAGALRIARAQRQELEVEAKTLQAEASAFDLGPDAVAAVAERTARELDEIEAGIARALAELTLPDLPPPEELEAKLLQLQAARDELWRNRSQLEGTLVAQNEILAEIADQRGRLQGSRAEIEGRLKVDLAILSDADRKHRLDEMQKACDEAEAAHLQKVEALEAHRRLVPSLEERERLRNRVARLEAVAENRKARLASLDREIANLEGQIQSAGGDGIGEKVESLREQRDFETREVERHRARIATLQLLRDTIEDCYKEQRDRLHAPLQRHLHPLVNDVFPAAELELGDGFSVSGLKRRMPEGEQFDRLSAGTQEQIAVLTRLAMGAMLAEQGQEVPIVLDDALVYSDDERIERMFDALNRAGRSQQVIVLTCRMRTFSRLGGTPLSIIQTLD